MEVIHAFLLSVASIGFLSNSWKLLSRKKEEYPFTEMVVRQTDWFSWAYCLLLSIFLYKLL